ncbi:MAG: hypothetical protein ACR2IE_17265 [Candidatus Sumerlaeaceae bacterium]
MFLRLSKNARTVMVCLLMFSNFFVARKCHAADFANPLKFPFPQVPKPNFIASVIDEEFGLYFLIDTEYGENGAVYRYNAKDVLNVGATGTISFNANISPFVIPLPENLESNTANSYGVTYDPSDNGILYFADHQKLYRMFNARSAVPQFSVRTYAAMKLPLVATPQKVSPGAITHGPLIGEPALNHIMEWDRKRNHVNFMLSDKRDVFIAFDSGELVRVDANTMQPFGPAYEPFPMLSYSGYHDDVHIEPYDPNNPDNPDDTNQFTFSVVPRDERSQAVLDHPFIRIALSFNLDGGVPGFSIEDEVIDDVDDYVRDYIDYDIDLFPDMRDNPQWPIDEAENRRYWQFPYEFKSGCILADKNQLLLGDNTGRVFKVNYFPDSMQVVIGLNETAITWEDYFKSNVRITPDVANVQVSAADIFGGAYFVTKSLTDSAAYADIVRCNVGGLKDLVAPVHSLALNDLTVVTKVFINDARTIAVDNKLGAIFVAGMARTDPNTFDSQLIARVARLNFKASTDLKLEKLLELNFDVNTNTDDFKGIRSNCTNFYRDLEGREALFIGVQAPTDGVAVISPFEPATLDYTGFFSLPGSLGYNIGEQPDRLNEAGTERIFATTKGRLKSRLNVFDKLNPLGRYGKVPVDFYLVDTAKVDLRSLASIQQNGTYVYTGQAKVGSRTFSRINGPNLDVRLLPGETPPFTHFVAVVDPANTTREVNETDNVIAGRIRYRLVPNAQ